MPRGSSLFMLKIEKIQIMTQQIEIKAPNKIDTFKKSIFAGVCISLGGTIYLSVGGIVGAVLFSFGLLAVVHYSLPLYTGKSGFCKTTKDLKLLPLILIGNIIGAFFFSICIKYAKPDLIQQADTIVKNRLSLNILQILMLSVGCGLIMTTIVKFAKKGKFIPLLIGIPVFILSGFIHSIADAFYYSLASLNIITDNILCVVIAYLSAVFGNFIGCVLPNGFLFDHVFDCEELTNHDGILKT